MSPTPSLPPVGGGSHPPLAELISRVGSAARSHCVTPRVLCCPHPSLKGTQQTMLGWHFSMAISSVSSRRNLCVACGTCHGSITGRELDTLNSDQGSAATEALVGLLLSSVLSGARLGSVSYDPDGTVRVGIPVFSTVYLETAFDTQPNIGDNQLEVQAEWAIASKLVFEATIGTQFNYADLFWETRF